MPAVKAAPEGATVGSAARAPKYLSLTATLVAAADEAEALDWLAEAAEEVADCEACAAKVSKTAVVVSSKLLPPPPTPRYIVKIVP
jgi:hypothetical protein